MYYPTGYNAIGNVPLSKGIVPPSVSTRGLKVREWLEEKRRRRFIWHGYKKNNQEKRRERMLARKKVTLFQRAERSIRRIFTRRER